MHGRAGSTSGLGFFDLRVMDVLWTHDAWLTVQNMCEEVNRMSPRTLAYSTIKTVLCHITEKHYAKKRALGRAHEYMACRTRTEAERAYVEDFLAPMLADRHALIAHLMDQIFPKQGSI